MTKTIRYLVIGVILLTATLFPPDLASASSGSGRELSEEEKESGFYSKEGHELAQDNRPAINPDFEPDESCLFDVFQLKCIPGSEQDCPEDFGRNEDATCFPLIDNGEWGCPEGYHTRDDDETGQCYSNERGCEWDNYIFLEGGEDGKGDRCAVLYSICDNNEYREHPKCIKYCKEFPDSFACKPELD